MTSRERLRAVFDHEQPDRMPIWMLFPYESEPIAADVNRLESYREVVEWVRKTDYIERNTLNIEYVGAKQNASTVDFLFNHPDVSKAAVDEVHGDGRTVGQRIEYGDLVIEKIVVNENGRTTVEPFLRNIDGLDRIMSLPYEIPQLDLSFYRQKAVNLGDRGLHGLLLVDPISTIHDICDETDFLLWAHTETAAFKNFLDFITPRMLEIYTQLLENDVGEIFFISGPEFLGAPLGRLEQFRVLVTEYDKALIDLIRQYGKRSILHCHGRISGILKEIQNINPDALQPVEPPPSGDCTLAEVRAALGPDMVLIGNIEYADLAACEPEEIDRAVAAAIAAGGPQNFILCPSCSPYEEEISERTAKNYIAMIKAGFKYGAHG